MPAVTRAALVQTLHTALQALPFVHAAWEGGSAAFGHEDRWSDVDAVVVADEPHFADAFAAVEAALHALSPLALVHVVAGTPGYAQRFYRLRDAGEFLVVDLVLLPADGPLRFREVELHGHGRTWFDRDGRLATEQHLDAAADAQAARERVPALASAFAMFQHLVSKDRLRGRALDALAFYQAYALRPLVEALRLLHAPQTRIFGLRYVQRDLPMPTADALARLAYVRDLDDLALRHAEACRWFDAALARLQGQGPGAGLAGLETPPC